ncbi:hypothetical protein OB905_07575 [Halobacteria archaeon AArc-dxtr1]|nr:hypothetical protein [Halobacteria archaeon AArc-dxtr1]
MYERSSSRSERDPFDALIDTLTAASRYDLLLAIVPAAFAVSLVATAVLGVSVQQALVVASTVGVFAIVDACYRNPPVEQGSN